MRETVDFAGGVVMLAGWMEARLEQSRHDVFYCGWNASYRIRLGTRPPDGLSYQG